MTLLLALATEDYGPEWGIIVFLLVVIAVVVGNKKGGGP